MKKFLQKVGAFFTKLFSDLKRWVAFLEQHVDDAIAVVQQIRTAVDNPVVMSLLMFLPEPLRSQVGDAREKAIAFIDAALNELLEGEACLQKETTIDKLRCFIEQLKKASPAKQEALYLKFASLYTKHSHGASLKTSQYDYAVQGRIVQTKFGIAV